MTGFCKRGNEPLGSINGWEFLKLAERLLAYREDLYPIKLVVVLLQVTESSGEMQVQGFSASGTLLGEVYYLRPQGSNLFVIRLARTASRDCLLMYFTLCYQPFGPWQMWDTHYRQVCSESVSRYSKTWPERDTDSMSQNENR